VRSAIHAEPVCSAAPPRRAVDDCGSRVVTLVHSDLVIRLPIRSAASLVVLPTPSVLRADEPTNASRKESWWEREWRRIEDYRVRPRKIVEILAPADDHDGPRNDLAQIDETWAERAALMY
jgi:hypothetical protein